MNTLDSTLLSMAGNLNSKLNPITLMFGRLLERITPKTTAQACGGYYCYCTLEGSCTFEGAPASYAYLRYTELPGCDGANCWVSLGCQPDGCFGY